MIELKLQYDSMLESEKHIILLQKIDEFNSKLNFDGDDSILEDESSLFEWISSNLSKTNFISLQEAEDEWEVISAKSKEVIESNTSFFQNDLISGNLASLIDDPIYVPYESGPCENACINALNNVNTRIKNVLELGSIQATNLLRQGNVMGAAVAYATTRLIVSNMAQNGEAAFYACMCRCNRALC